MTWDFGELATCAFDSFLAIGAMDTGLLNSPHATVYANELASMARRVWRGIPVDDDALAMDVIKSVGAGMYLTQTHTALHARKDLWRGKIYQEYLPGCLGKVRQKGYGRADT